MSNSGHTVGESLDDWARFKASGEKCFFCFLGWQKYEKAHLEPNNLGWVECDALSDDPKVKP